MGRIDEDRKRFQAVFGYLFTPTSPAMAQKCWVAVKRDLPRETLRALIAAMCDAGRAKMDLQEARPKR